MLIYSAKAQVKITGEVKSQEGQPVPYANVLLLQSIDSLFVTGGVTDMNGRFILNARPASYLLNIKMLGHKNYFLPIEVGPLQDSVKLSPVTLMEDAHELNEVVVNGKLPVFEKKADRMNINVENMIGASGSSVLQVLENSPGVVINRAGNSISMFGKSGARVMINDKLIRMPAASLLQMLEGMNASNIGKIELISVPSSKYDAEGKAGIINIKVKESPDSGTNGSIGVTFGYNFYETRAGNFTVNHRKNKLNAYLNYSIHYDHNRHWTYINRIHTKNGFEQSDTDTSRRNPYLTIHNLAGGIELELFSKSRLNFNITGYRRGWDSKNFTFNRFRISADTLQSTEIVTEGLNIWNGLGAGAGFVYKSGNLHEMKVSYDFLFYQNKNTNEYTNVRRINYSEDPVAEKIFTRKKTPIHFHVVSFDYSLNVTPGFVAEAGIKGTISDFINNARVIRQNIDGTVEEPSLTGNSLLNEKIFAAYILLKLKSGDYWNIDGGMRYENTDTHLDISNQLQLKEGKYHSFFPSVSMSFRINNYNQIHVGYSRRINRPNYNQMAPFIAFFGLNTYISGNLSLLPAYTEGAEISYNRKKLWLTLFYSDTKNAVAEYQSEFDPVANVLIYKSQNLKYDRRTGVNISTSVQTTSWWKMQNYLSVSRQDIKTSHLSYNIRKNLYHFSFSSNNTFTITKNLSADISGTYLSPELWGISRFFLGGKIDVGTEYKIRNRHFLSLRITDIFNTRRWNLKTRRDSYSSNWEYDFGLRAFTLSYRYNYGNRNIRAVKIRNGAESERNRVK